MKKGIFTTLFCLVIGFVLGQSDGDYRTRASGNWNQVNRWQVFVGGAWQDLETLGAGIFRNRIPSNNSGNIDILSGHTIRVTTATLRVNQLEVQVGARLIVNPNRTLRIVDDFTQTPLIVAGTLTVNGTLDLLTQLSTTPCLISGMIESNAVISISNASLLSFSAGSQYRHYHPSGGIVPLATWDDNSTCLIAGMNKANPAAPLNLSQSFGNFTWNTPSMGNTSAFSLEGGLQTVNGDLTFVTTGSTPRQVRLNNGGPGYNLTIGGNFVIQGGLVTLAQSQSSATSVSVGGNLEISGGTLTLGNTNNSAINVLLNGNFVKTGGLINRGGGTGSGTIRFDGGLQTYTNDVNITSAVNFSVESGSNLNLGTSFLTGTGTFTLNSGGILQVGSLDAAGAIQAGTTGGNIRVSGVRTYQTNSEIIYNGAGEQFMASGHPAAPNTTIDNSNNVFLLANITTNGTLSLLNGVFGLESFTLTIAGVYDRTNGFIGIVPGSSLNIQGSGAFDSLVLFNYGDNSMNNFTLNRAGVTVNQGIATLTINGAFTQIAGNYAFSSFGPRSLTLLGAFSQAVGTSISSGTDNDDTFVIAGSGALPAAINLSGTFSNVTMNRSGGIFTAGTAFSAVTLTLRDGDVVPANLITIPTNGRIVREFGAIDAAPIAQTSYDVIYGPAFDVTTGPELPTNNTALDSLILNNTFNVTNPQGSVPHVLTLAAPVFVNGSLVVTEGTFSPGTNAVNIRRNLVVGTDGIIQPGQSTFTFDGGIAQTVTGTAQITLFNVAVDQAPASTLTIGSALDIENELAVNSASTVAAGTNLLRLLSTPTRTANVAEITGGGSITGSVIVQRHLPKAVAKRSFFYMGSPVTNTTVADWDVELPIAKAYRWNEPTKKYVAYSLNGALPSGLGLSVDVNSTATFTTDVRGTLRQGPVSVNVTSQDPDPDSDDGWNLIGNPYPSAIDWDQLVLPAGIENSMYITDNFNNSGQGNGLQRVTYVDGVGVPAGYSGQISQGQAFWIKATANTTLDFTEAAKISATDTQFYREGEIPNVLRIVMEGQGLMDEAVVRLREGATSKFDGRYDARKFFDDEFKLATLTSDNIKTAINALGTEDCGAPVPLIVEGAAVGEYTFNFNGLESFGSNVSIVFEDLLANKAINVMSEKTYSFSITDENSSSLGSRFRISITTATVNTSVKATGQTLCADSDAAIVTIKDSEKGVSYSATWKGEKVSGTEIGTGATIQLAVKTSALSSGDNAITVWASSGLCSQAALLESPVVTKVSVADIVSVADGTVCNEGTATLTAGRSDEGGYYNWYDELNSSTPISDQKTGQFVTPVLTKTKTYYVAAVNALGCEGERVPVKAVVSYLDDLSLTVENATLTSNHTSGNQWYLNDQLIVDATSNTLTVSEAGNYTVTVNKDGCALSASRQITQVDIESGTNLDALVSIYPNPTQSKVYVQVRSSNDNVKAVILNATGVEMESKVLTGEGGVKQGEFDMLLYSTGIYNLRIIDGSRLSIKKIAKVN